MPVIDWIINIQQTQVLLDSKPHILQDIARIYQLAVVLFNDMYDIRPASELFNVRSEGLAFLKKDLIGEDFRGYTACHLTAKGLIELFGDSRTETTVKTTAGSNSSIQRNSAIQAAISALEQSHPCIISIKGYTNSADGHSFCLLKNEDDTVTTLEAWSTRGSINGRPFLLSYYYALRDAKHSDYPTRSTHDTILSLRPNINR